MPPKFHWSNTPVRNKLNPFKKITHFYWYNSIWFPWKPNMCWMTFYPHMCQKNSQQLCLNFKIDSFSIWQQRTSSHKRSIIYISAIIAHLYLLTFVLTIIIKYGDTDTHNRQQIALKAAAFISILKSEVMKKFCTLARNQHAHKFHVFFRCILMLTQSHLTFSQEET